MAKLVLSSGGTMLHHYFVDKERITIGRDPQSTVVIDDPAMSREHAAIFTIGNDQIIEDLQSSNGTLVNGTRVSRQILHHGDVIEFGAFSLRYLNPKLATEINLEHTMLIDGLAGENVGVRGGAHASLEGVQSRSVKVRFPKAKIKIIFGPRAPSTVELNRVVATLGKEGKQLAVITRRPMGFFVTHVEGNGYPRVNKQNIGREPRALQNHDVVEVGEDTVEFLLD